MPFFKKFDSGDACTLLPLLSAEESIRYQHFRALLDHNRGAMTLMAHLEQTYYDNRPFTIQAVERSCNGLFLEVEGMAKSLDGLSGQGYEALFAILNSLRRYTRDELTLDIRTVSDRLFLGLDDIDPRHARDVGAKAANLAAIGRTLHLLTPPGFVLTTNASHLFFRETGITDFIHEALVEVAADDPDALEDMGQNIRKRILESPLPEIIQEAIQEGVLSLGRGESFTSKLAVRSSAVGEDGEISFAGQYTSLLNVDPADLCQAYKQVVASKYSAQALSYRIHHGLDDRETPMAVLVIEMVEPRFSGVVYTADPTTRDRNTLRVSSVEGLGDVLVGGETSPKALYWIEKHEFKILDLPENERPPSSSPEDASDLKHLRLLWEAALKMEKHWGRPLDIEWALDHTGRLFILQARPLLVVEEAPEEQGTEPDPDFPGHPLVMDGGRCAANGVVSGRVLVLKNTESGHPLTGLSPDTILVMPTASTSITPWVGKVKGIITDRGGVASHLASVAREFGVPALFDTQNATTVLKTGQEITLWASHAKVYSGVVHELTRGMRPVKRPIFASPSHLRMQRVLDYISPLNLTDPDAPEFVAEGCKTVHDIIRFCHEMSVREMFRFGETAGRMSNTVRLKVSIPVELYAMDLGGGLSQGLTSCDEINAYDVVSTPFRAVWSGLTHPGINWSSTIAVGAHNFMSLLAGGGLPQQGRLGGASYVLVSHDYMNLNMRFGYHFATVDTLCGDHGEDNYIRLQFAGGAGAYSGRSLRIQYLANVLSRLGFETTLKGDLIEAVAIRLDRAPLEKALDQLGRLLGTTRLLDMAINNLGQINRLTDAFFQGRYDLLEQEQEDAPKDFHVITGNWKISPADKEPGILQDGSDFGSWITTGLSRAMMRVLGKRYQEFLDNIEAYYYFPLAIAKESLMTHGTLRVRVKPLAGVIDQAGGLAFALRDWANYFVFRVNALSDTAILFEFKNGRRIQRKVYPVTLETGTWRHLRVDLEGRRIRTFLEDQPVMEYDADRDLDGYAGLWTKADSVTLFNDFQREEG